MSGGDLEYAEGVSNAKMIDIIACTAQVHVQAPKGRSNSKVYRRLLRLATPARNDIHLGFVFLKTDASQPMN